MDTVKETYYVTLAKLAQRALGDRAIEGNQSTIVASINSKSLKISGWQVSEWYVNDGPKTWAQCFASEDEDAKYRYEMYMTVSYEGRKAPSSQEAQGILASIWRKAKTPAYGSWTLATVNGEEYVPVADGETPFSDDLVGYSEVTIPDDWQSYFTHLYGLDAHIMLTMSSIQAGLDSAWSNREHVVLVGPPGCGKSDTASTFKELLGADQVLEFDATAMTSAGVIKTLAEIDILPRVMVIEEMEKAPAEALSFLLSMCDRRGEIRKTTYRQSIQRDTKVLVIATVNDYDLFCKMAGGKGEDKPGALASRFPQTIWFDRPSRDLLSMILHREVAKVNGRNEWVAPTLDYCEENDITDPRKAISICVCGKDMLITGEYQKMLRATAKPQAKRQALAEIEEG